MCYLHNMLNIFIFYINASSLNMFILIYILNVKNIIKPQECSTEATTFSGKICEIKSETKK